RSGRQCRRDVAVRYLKRALGDLRDQRGQRLCEVATSECSGAKLWRSRAWPGENALLQRSEQCVCGFLLAVSCHRVLLPLCVAFVSAFASTHKTCPSELL